MTMLSRLSRLHINGASSIFVKSIANYCTSAAQTAQSHNAALADFLVKSLGFSKEAAAYASNKVSRTRPLENKPALVVNYLENLGLGRAQIRSIVSSVPRLLFNDVDKTLEPKIEFFRDLGLSGSELARVITANQLRQGLDSCTKPRTEYLRQLLGSDDRVVAALKRCYFVLNFDPEMMEKNISVLRKYGISDEYIVKLILWNPRLVFGTKPESLLEKLQRVENDLGIPRDSPMFIYGFRFLNTYSLRSINLKFGVLRSYGWSDEDILKMVRILPLCMNMSVDRMRRTLDYYMKELGYSIDYLASRPRFFTFDLERRVKPRNEVVRILNETKFNKRKVSLYNLLVLPTSRFVQTYVLRYKDELPDMYEAYIQKVGIQKIGRNTED